MGNSEKFRRLGGTVWLLGGLIALVSAASASAATLATLHAFCSFTNCNDGRNPSGGLLRDASGNLYGTAEGEGAHGDVSNGGTVFELVPNGTTGKYKDYVLHAFCAQTNCADGNQPDESGVIMDVDGNLYGVTFFGGKFNHGGVFKLTHGTNGWGLKVLHNFCGTTGCPDGDGPGTGLSYAGQASGALWDKVSPLFGVTVNGGSHNHGTVFELTQNGTHWIETVVHSFDTSADPAGLLVTTAGDIYGTAVTGGKYGGGLMYTLANRTWKETVLHNFCNVTNCTDGRFPEGHLVMDGSGDLFGVTAFGGTNTTVCNQSTGCGVAFEYAAGGTFSVLYNFCSLAACSDGTGPDGGLTLDGSGTLFGVTLVGGAANMGTVYNLKPNGGSWAESVLYSFCQLANCKDGAEPTDQLILDSSGDIFGDAYSGGNSTGPGTVFELKP
ncbi:MAG TPA: choice-of-anchor tandem repeat GloVer-containing protein [Rhizomicrobium sp.]|jgi:uncharacterized repeat protein (TIGR03803 family)